MLNGGVIELIGTPGAGKTTVAAGLAEELTLRGFAPLRLPEAGRLVARRSAIGSLLPERHPRLEAALAWRLFSIERLWRGLVFLAARPRLVWLLVATQSRRPRSAQLRRRRVVHWWLRMAGTRAMLVRRRLPNEVVLLDEGFYHRVVQLFASADEMPDRETISRYIALVPAPDRLIHVSASLDECRRRILARGVWRRFEDEGEDRLMAFLRSAEAAVTAAVDEASHRPGVLDTVDNGSSPEDIDLSGVLAMLGTEVRT